VSVNDFALVVVGDTHWAWDLDAVAAAIASTWPDAQIRDGYPLSGSTYRVFAYIPDARTGREIEVGLDDSGKMISLEYGSPEGSAEFVTWVLNRFPPPTMSPSSCSSGDTTPKSPRAPPSRTCSPSVPDHRPSAHRRRGRRLCSAPARAPVWHHRLPRNYSSTTSCDVTDARSPITRVAGLLPH
jgi:hypothetical protein